MRSQALLRVVSFASMIFSCAFVAISANSAAAQTETVVYSFQANTGSVHGYEPFGGLVADRTGALYGTAAGGRNGTGIVFKLVPPSTRGGAWRPSIIYSFGAWGTGDGIGPTGNLALIAKSGEIYGTTTDGGRYGGGTVYQLAVPAKTGDPWTETVLYNFTEGEEPLWGVVADSKGRLYGTTYYGGSHKNGSVFRLTPPSQPGGSWTETTLYNFNGYGLLSQAYPSSVIVDASGALYGTTGALNGVNAGVVYQLAPPSGTGRGWTQNILYSFGGITGDGIYPEGGLIFDSAGALYGNTLEGGLFGSGTVFELSPPSEQGGAWTESVLYSFSQGTGDGFYPVASLVFDSAGSIYGVTQSGGIESCGDADNGCGTIFRLDPPSSQGGQWTEGYLYAFQGGSDGNYPQAPVTAVSGDVYGTTVYGGIGYCSSDGDVGCGTVFQITQ